MFIRNARNLLGAAAAVGLSVSLIGCSSSDNFASNSNTNSFASNSGSSVNDAYAQYTTSSPIVYWYWPADETYFNPQDGMFFWRDRGQIRNGRALPHGGSMNALGGAEVVMVPSTNPFYTPGSGFAAVTFE